MLLLLLLIYLIIQFYGGFSKKYNIIKVKSALDMKFAVEKEFCNADCVIMAAAVADYRVKETAPQKMKKTEFDCILTARTGRVYSVFK